MIANGGPFAGMRVVLLEERAQARVAVRLAVLRQAVSVELPQHILGRCCGGTCRAQPLGTRTSMP